ncbi:hypothetical protein [Allosediminivita pacifica]|nr:hypothetical protein [Allosediminivita pacifica]
MAGTILVLNWTAIRHAAVVHEGFEPIKTETTSPQGGLVIDGAEI